MANVVTRPRHRGIMGPTRTHPMGETPTPATPATSVTPSTPATDDEPVRVEGLLVCRSVENSPSGGITVRDVLDIVPVAGFPGEAGPLAFAAFVRPARAGEAGISFRIHPVMDASVTVASLPGKLTIAKGFEGRQTVIYSGFKSLTVKQGGWYGVEFRVGERVLARTRFAVGARGTASPKA